MAIESEALAEGSKPNPILQCIWNIPLCGGFCAPSISKEPSFLRHFSNEYTLPCGQGKFMQLSPYIEHSRCCVCCGKLGVAGANRYRKHLFLFAFALSFISWILLAYCLSALSADGATIKRGFWVSGEFNHPTLGKTNVFVGTNRVVTRISCSDVQCEEVLGADGFSKTGNGMLQKVMGYGDGCSSQFFPNATTSHSGTNFCESCREEIAGTEMLMIMGFLTQIPQMTTDLQRSTLFGDVNCQATMGAVTSLWGFLSTFVSLARFAGACYRDFPSSVTYLDGSSVKIDWDRGPVLICMTIATVLKFVDAMIHVIVPTPSQRWKKPESEVSTTEEYLVLADGNVDDMSVSMAGRTASSGVSSQKAAPIIVGRPKSSQTE